MKGTRSWAILLVALCTFLTSGGQLLFKLGVDNIVLTIIGLITNYNLILGFFLYGIGAIMLVIALKYGELSVLYPVVALSFVWVAILSYIFLGESVGPFRAAGVLFIILGVSAIGKGSNHKSRIKLRK